MTTMGAADGLAPSVAHDRSRGGGEASRPTTDGSALPRVIVALDLDAFYVAAARRRDPSLVGKAVGIKQKALVATISYEAREHGVAKLESVRSALQKCPHLVLVDGEDLSYFRTLSAAVARVVRRVVWRRRVEKLGMDELYCDVTDMVDAHLARLDAGSGSPRSGGGGTDEQVYFDLRPPDATEHSGPEARHRQQPCSPQRNSEVQMSPDAAAGFWYRKTDIPGHMLPADDSEASSSSPRDHLSRRIIAAGHLAAHLRGLIHDQVGLTASAGVAESKLLAKLVGAVHKPNQQTLFLPPPVRPRRDGTRGSREEWAHELLAPLPLRKITGFGFSIHRTLRAALRGDASARGASTERAGDALATPEEMAGWEQAEASEMPLTVSFVRSAFSAQSLEALFGARLGARLWGLLWGRDDELVVPAPEFPAQISVEDTFPKPVRGAELHRQLEALSFSLLRRLETEMLGDDTPAGPGAGTAVTLGDMSIFRPGLLEFQPLDCPLDRELQPQALQGSSGAGRNDAGHHVRTYKQVDILDWLRSDGASGGAGVDQGRGGREPQSLADLGLVWRRYARTLRLGVRLNWGSRTTRQARMPVEVFELRAPRAERARTMARALAKLLRALLGASFEDQPINLLNVAALDWTSARPNQAIRGWLRPASSTDPSAAPEGRAAGSKARGVSNSPSSSASHAVGDDGDYMDPAVLAELPDDVRAELLEERARRTRSKGARPTDAPRKREPPDPIAPAASAPSVPRGDADADADLVPPSPGEGQLRCAVCGGWMWVWWQHDHAAYPTRGVPPSPTSPTASPACSSPRHSPRPQLPRTPSAGSPTSPPRTPPVEAEGRAWERAHEAVESGDVEGPSANKRVKRDP